MALIPCDDCKREISDATIACPHCGRPVGQRPVTTQQTAKRYKGLQLIGAIMVVSGITSVGVTISERSAEPTGAMIGSLLFLFGFVIFLTGRLLAWWNHG